MHSIASSLPPPPTSLTPLTSSVLLSSLTFPIPIAPARSPSVLHPASSLLLPLPSPSVAPCFLPSTPLSFHIARSLAYLHLYPSPSPPPVPHSFNSPHKPIPTPSHLSPPRWRHGSLGRSRWRGQLQLAGHGPRQVADPLPGPPARPQPRQGSPALPCPHMRRSLPQPRTRRPLSRTCTRHSSPPPIDTPTPSPCASACEIGGLTLSLSRMRNSLSLEVATRARGGPS